MHRTPTASHAAGILAPTLAPGASASSASGRPFDLNASGSFVPAGRADRGQHGLAPTFRP
jgi:hypothetical protein